MSNIERPRTRISDAESCIIVYQVLKALEYLHRQRICHRDLKAENILMSTPTLGARVLLADSGHSVKLSGGKRLGSQQKNENRLRGNGSLCGSVRVSPLNNGQLSG